MGKDSDSIGAGVVLAILASLAIAYGSQQIKQAVPSSEAKPVEAATDDAPKEIQGVRFALVTAPWCEPCQRLERQAVPAIEQLLNASGESLEEINADKLPKRADQLLAGGTKKIPAIVAYRDTEGGIEIVDRLYGNQPTEKALEFVRKLYRARAPGACDEVERR